MKYSASGRCHEQVSGEEHEKTIVEWYLPASRELWLKHPLNQRWYPVLNVSSDLSFHKLVYVLFEVT